MKCLNAQYIVQNMKHTIFKTFGTFLFLMSLIMCQKTNKQTKNIFHIPVSEQQHGLGYYCFVQLLLQELNTCAIAE